MSCGLGGSRALSQLHIFTFHACLSPSYLYLPFMHASRFIVFLIPGHTRPLVSTSMVLPLMGIVNNRYRYCQDLLALASTDPIRSPPAFGCSRTPIRLDALLPYLHSHPDQLFASYIFIGIRDGFRIGFDRSSTRLQSSSHNHPSSNEHPDTLDSHISTEVQAGRLYTSRLRPQPHPNQPYWPDPKATRHSSLEANC